MYIGSLCTRGLKLEKASSEAQMGATNPLKAVWTSLVLRKGSSSHGMYLCIHQEVKLYVLVLETSQTCFLLCPCSLCMILITSCIDNVQGLVVFL